MRTVLAAAWAVVCVNVLPVPCLADPYVWDNQHGNGIWNDPVNWGLLNTPGLDIEPTSADSAIFRSGSPAGIVVLTNDGFAQKIRQNVSAPARTITIGPDVTADCTLTLSGTATELFECIAATSALTLEGTPNAQGARLKLVINGAQPSCPVNAGQSLALNCDISGSNGIALNAGSSGTGRLILGGTNTYTGPTAVNAGTLLVNGSTAPASTVTAAAGTTLGGHGWIGGSASVAANATLAPGTAIGTLGIGGNLTLSGNLVIEVDKSLSPSNDMVSVTGSLSKVGTGTVTVNNLRPSLPLSAGDTFQLFNKPLAGGGAMSIVSGGGELWTNRLAVDGSIAVLPSTNVPSPPTALAATGVTADGFTANWSASTGATGYRLDVSTNSLFSSFVSGYQDLDTANVLSWSVTGLSWSPTNYYRVRAYNANGTSGNSTTIAVPTPPPSPRGDPTTVYTWNCTSDTNQNWSFDANWVGGVAPKPGSSNIIVFRGNILVPWNWPNVDTNYGTTILIFSNDIALNGIKITGGIGNTMNLGSYVLNDQPTNAESPSYFGIDSPIDIPWSQRGGGNIHSVNANFTNALGDASCGSQTDFKCVGARLDVYGVLRDGLGTHSRLVKSGTKTLNITGMHANTYTGGTVVNAGPIKMAKPAGIDAIPGDVTVNGSGGLIMNVCGGEQIANAAIVTLNDSASVSLGGQPETVQTVQSTSANSSILLGASNVNCPGYTPIFTVAPASDKLYNGGMGESVFAGSISDGGDGAVVKNGGGTYTILGATSVSTLIVNGGTLKINGNSGTGPVTVNTGGTLVGQGTIAGAVTVASGATLAAGFGAGLLTLPAGLNLSAGGSGPTNVWELVALKDGATGVAGGDFDQIVLTSGTLALGTQATLDIRFTGSASAPNGGSPFWQSPHTWTVILLNGGSNPNASNFGRIKNGEYTAGHFTTTATANGIVLTFTPKLVPSTAAPRITSILNTGPGTVAVSYTNTLSGTNYTLAYTTNLNATTNWYPAGVKAAAGTTDSQTDTSATNGQRYYRVLSP